MSYRQGDVLLVPFPFTNQSGTKQRPAVVLSGDAYNQAHRDMILAPITSQVTHRPDEVSLVDWQAAGLLKPSVVKPIISSFDVRLVRLKLGSLSASDRTQVRALFARVLDLPLLSLLLSPLQSVAAYSPPPVSPAPAAQPAMPVPSTEPVTSAWLSTGLSSSKDSG